MSIVLKPQKGPQEMFLASPADICIYGGSAGGGKSYALLLQALRYKNVKGFGCTIFRKNFNQIFAQGGLWDESTKMYYQIKGAVGTASRGQWIFTDKDGEQVSRVNFAHIERDEDVFKFQGSQIPAICCEKNTPVLMSNGVYKNICDIKVGDSVKTLNGDATVNFVYDEKEDECVLVEMEEGTKQIHNLSHKILTKQGWVSYEDIISSMDKNNKSCCSKQSHSSCKFFESQLQKSQYQEMPHHKTYSNREHKGLSGLLSLENLHKIDHLSHILCVSLQPLICGSNECFLAEQFEKYLQQKLQEFYLLHDNQHQGLEQALESSKLEICHLALQEFFSCMVQPHQEIDCESFVEKSQVSLKHILSHPLAELVSQGHMKYEGKACHDFLCDEFLNVQTLKQSLGYQQNCFACSHLCDEQIRQVRDNDQDFSLVLNDVVVYIPNDLHSCGKDRIPKGIHGPLLYTHPYNEYSILSEEVCVDYQSIKITPIGKRFVIPIEVNYYNHYITNTGIVNRNCFDELTHFSEKTFFYMLSRNRSMCGIKPYVKATCNPDAESWVAKFIDWWIDPVTGYPIKERSGQLRYFIRRDGILYWADTPEELWEQFNLKTPEELAEPKSVAFISSSIYDNKELLKVNPQYLANLKALSVIEKERLLYGNWKIKSAAGLYFKRDQVRNMLEIVPADIVKFVRCWDLAATSEDENGQAAYTAGVLLGKRKDGSYIVIDVINRQLSANDVRQLVKHTAQIDKAKYKRVTVRIPQDPGQAGKAQAQSFIKFMAGYNIKAVAETGSKESRAEPFAAQWQGGNVDMVIGEWNEPYLLQLEAFPEGKWKDMVDASANAFIEIESSSTFNPRSLI